MNLILVIHAFSCWSMCGLNWLVAPLMGIEIGSAIWILFLNQNGLYWANLISVILIWVQTAFVNVPSHNKLSFEIEKTKLALVAGNWPRTIFWTARSCFLLWILFKITIGVTP